MAQTNQATSGSAPHLLTLPAELRAKILEHTLRIDELRIECTPYFTTLHAVELNRILVSGAIARCNLQLFKESLQVFLRCNKFVAMKGWSSMAQRTLEALGQIPMWRRHPLPHGSDKANYPYLLLPCSIQPVWTLCYRYEGRERDTIFVSIKDFGLICKALYQLHGIPLEGLPRQMIVRFRHALMGLAPADLGFPDLQSVQTYFHENLVMYLGDHIREIFFGPHYIPLAPQQPQPFMNRPLSPVEEFFRSSLRQWTFPPLLGRAAWAEHIALGSFDMAEAWFKAGNLYEAIPLYMRTKELVDHLCRESIAWRENQSANVIRSMLARHSVSCFRLGHMAELHFDQTHSHSPAEYEGMVQWAYINVTECLSQIDFVGRQAMPRIRLQILQAKLRHQLGHPDGGTGASLILACLLLAEHRHAQTTDWAAIKKFAAHYYGRKDPRVWPLHISQSEGFVWAYAQPQMYVRDPPVVPMRTDEWDPVFQRVEVFFNATFDSGVVDNWKFF